MIEKLSTRFLPQSFSLKPCHAGTVVEVKQKKRVLYVNLLESSTFPLVVPKQKNLRFLQFIAGRIEEKVEHVFSPFFM